MSSDEAIALGLAIGILLLTAWLQRTMHRRYRTWTPVTGVVIRVRPEDGGRSLATIRYEKSDATMAEFSQASIPETLGVGSEIPLLCCPRSGKVMTDLPGERHIAVAMGYFFVGAMLVLFLCYRYGGRAA